MDQVDATGRIARIHNPVGLALPARRSWSWWRVRQALGRPPTLAGTRRLLAEQGRGLVVVTPRLKAAKVAFSEVDARAGSAALLALRHGWRWGEQRS